MRITVLSIALLILATAPLHGMDSGETDSVNYRDYEPRIIGAPWASLSSDQGFSAGFSVGWSNSPVDVLYLIGYASTNGYASLGLRGEMQLQAWRISESIYGTRILRMIYPEESGNPDYTAKGRVNRITAMLSLLKRYEIRGNFSSDRKGQRSTQSENEGRSSSGGVIEIGPDIYIDIAKGEKAVDFDGKSISISSIPRFKQGSSMQLGVRFRYRTTSPMRPIDGILTDVTLRFGRAGGDAGNMPAFDMSNRLLAAAAVPINSDLRIYIRGMSDFQLNSPPPARNTLGAECTLRGQPDQRDIGRRIISGRLQTHYTMYRSWVFPSRVLRTIWNKFPLIKLDVESVLFADVGRAGDPDYGWSKSRSGFGFGVRFVAPPELVLFFDIARSPGGDIRYYIGTGETL